VTPHQHRAFLGLVSKIPGWVLHLEGDAEDSTLVVAIQHLLPVMQFLRDHQGCLFEQLVDVTALDHGARDPRFDLIYHLLSVEHNSRLCLRVPVREGLSAPSVTSLYPSAGWYEREVWDLFGIHFTGHADLRRLLTDYGFQGHPLRKDFPLSGYTETVYREEEHRVVTEPLELAQEFRQFWAPSPWETLAQSSETRQEPSFQEDHVSSGQDDGDHPALSTPGHHTHAGS
jgi:NADH/F420H2 dehydrogenase subunit C